MPDKCVVLKFNNLFKTSRMSSAKGVDSNERRINLWLAKSKRFKSSSLKNENKDNLILKIRHSETYVHKAGTKSEKSNESDLTLPKLLDSQNKSLTSSNNSLLLGQVPSFQQYESSGDNNVYESLPRIKKVYDKTSLTEKNKKTYDDSLIYIFPTEKKQCNHWRRVSSTKLVNNVPGKVEKGAERDENPQLQDKTKIENKEKLYSKPSKEKTIQGDKAKLEDEKKQRDQIKLGIRTKIEEKSNIGFNPKIETKLPLDNKTKLEDKYKKGYDDEKLRHKTKRLGNRTKIDDVAKSGNRAKLENKLKLKEKLRDKSKIDEETKLVYTAQIEDETKQEDTTKLENKTKIEEKANKGDKTKLESKHLLENKDKLEDTYKIDYNSEKIGYKTKLGNISKMEDIGELVNKDYLDYKPKLKEKLSNESKFKENIILLYTAQIGKKTKQNITKTENKADIGVEPKLDSKVPLENKAKLEDKYKIGYNVEKLGDKTQLGNTTKIEEPVKKEEVHFKKVDQGYPPSMQNNFFTEREIIKQKIELGEKHTKIEKQSLLKEQHAEKAMREIIQKRPIVVVTPMPSLKSHNTYDYDKGNYDKDFIIKGNKILKHTKSMTKQDSQPQHQTENRKTIFSNTPSISKKEKHKRQKTKVDGQGILRFALSNPKFIDMGWTKLPTQKVVRKVNVYRMRPSHPEYDWFRINKGKQQMRYDSGETLALFDDDGCGCWFYRNGNLALNYYNAEEFKSNANQRYVVYSSEDTDERGCSQPRTVLATFDHLGNGIIFDHSGKVRLKYDQNEGVVLDRSIGLESHWKWHALNDPPVLQQVMIDTQLPFKDPRITGLWKKGDDKAKTTERCEHMLAIEHNNFIRDMSKKISQSYEPYQITMKAFKINQYFSLRILDQATIYLIYRDGTHSIKLNIGMRLDPTKILDTVSHELGDIFNTLERFPAPTESIATMQRLVQQAKDAERARVRHERRLRPLKTNISTTITSYRSDHPFYLVSNDGDALSDKRENTTSASRAATTSSASACSSVGSSLSHSDPVEVLDCSTDCSSTSSTISKPCSFKLYCGECDDITSHL